MRVVIAPDKFRGSLTAPEAARAIGLGVRRADPAAKVDLVPMADGGEGTVEALVEATAGTFREAIVSGPLGDSALARFGILGDGSTAAIEMAAASGHALVPPGSRDPTRTSTRGTGDLMLAAIRAGATRLVVGIGGSATNDGGSGMAQALGFRLLDRDGRDLGPGGGPLRDLRAIEPGPADLLAGVSVLVACDVANVLCGPDGASVVYGPQKGATPEMVVELDENLGHLARIIARDLGPSVAEVPGGGAAGGLGSGLIAFAGGRLVPGIDLVIEAVGLADRLIGADLCLTGEGAIDASSASGKTAVGVARLARSSGVPCLALAGSIGPGAGATLDAGLDAYFAIAPGPGTLQESIARAAGWLADAAEQATRAFLAGRRGRAGAER